MLFDERDCASIVRDLGSPDEDVRRLAVERAEVLPADTALPLLVERLGDTSWRVRKAAVGRLVACPETGRVTDLLVGALADGENPGRRNGAVEALVLCGARAVPALVAASGSADSDVRKLVVDALAGIGDTFPAQALIDLLEDADPNVRAAAADALGAIGVEEATRPLLQLACRRDEDPLVRFAALRSLGALEARVGTSELEPAFEDPLLRGPALDLLGREDRPDAVEVILKGLVDASRSVREAAMRAVLRLLAHVDGPRADELVARTSEAAASMPTLVDDAIERLADADLPRGLVLVQFLGLLRPKAAILPLLGAARDEALAEVVFATLQGFGEEAEHAVNAVWDGLDPDVQRYACELFGRSEGERSGARLVEALEDADPELRMAAARASADRGLVEALAPLARQLTLLAATDDVEAEEELAALVDAMSLLAAASEAARAKAVELLDRGLEGAPAGVRLALARVLCRVATREDAPRIDLLLKDASAEVRRLAAGAFAHFEPDAAPEALRLALADEDAGVRVAAAGALGTLPGSALIEDLRRLADDRDPRVRAAGVRSLARRLARADPAESRDTARSGLESALADDPLVALAALEALDELGGALARHASSVLERPEPELVREAVRCLGRHADPEGLETLIPLVSHPDWSVRAEAIEALAQRGVRRAMPPILRLLEGEHDDFVRAAILRALERLEA
ncbi:MAG: HEAT repeat domain-containing protein [Myxococcota bacterium]|nr:HEAT repeat domain-containing protein [Myxococcota bacterium]